MPADIAQQIKREDFEKDDDSNFHIDFIYAMANCRALNYGLAEMDWLTTKLKAGRIVPALATTTAAIAALQTLEAIKIVAGFKLNELKNFNLNLALPDLIQMEPFELMLEKLTDSLSCSVWDRWEIRKFGDNSLQ